MGYIYRTAIGQDSHRYREDGCGVLRLAGVEIPNAPTCEANSDGDVVFHAVTNAVSGLTGVNILGRPADKFCQAGITDSKVYLDEALKHLGALSLVHLSLSVEAARPRLEAYIPAIRAELASALGLALGAVGLTATSGEGLSGMGRGEGMQVICILTAREPEEKDER